MTLSRESTRHIHTIMPAREAVTLRVRVAEGSTFTSYSLGGARRKPASHKQAAAAGLMLGETAIVWQVYDVELDAASAPVPGPGSQIVDSSSVVWVVRQVDTRLFGNVFDLVCSLGR